MRIFGRSIEVVILDIDGVLVDSIGHFVHLFEEVAERSDLPAHHVRTYFEELREGKYRSHHKLKHNIIGLWPDLAPHHVSHFVSMMREKEKQWPYPPYEGVIETLKRLKLSGIRLAICTRNSASTVSVKLYNADINEEWFEYVSVPGRYAKPDPRSVEAILNKMDVSPEKAVYVGDWHPDLDAARNAQVPFIGVTCGCLSRNAFLKENLPEEHIIESLPDILNLATF